MITKQTIGNWRLVGFGAFAMCDGTRLSAIEEAQQVIGVARNEQARRLGQFRSPSWVPCYESIEPYR